jgi:hypothetical protein
MTNLTTHPSLRGALRCEAIASGRSNLLPCNTCKPALARTFSYLSFRARAFSDAFSIAARRGIPLWIVQVSSRQVTDQPRCGFSYLHFSYTNHCIINPKRALVAQTEPRRIACLISTEK